MWEKVKRLWKWLRVNEPKFTRIVGLTASLYIALAAFAKAQIPVIKEVWALIHPLLLEFWKIIAG